MDDRDELDLPAIRRQLQQRLAETERLEAISAEDSRPVTLDQSSVGRLSRMDAMRVQAMAQETGRRRAKDRRRIVTALERLASGDYGYCAQCDEPIPVKRLTLDPAVPNCVDCAGNAGRG